ncbi:mevalonate kinase [Streptomyces sp. S07_1.15]|uniref:mevalonate kinase n=1 Tax=Streptomyces sp. S07_1.15 TaxID=2873925 RepID=UPI001D147D48|nr:mevalonate kinase [Streptomyces sp. S07_1.15]MCC3653116.1 mevalonate kinase [Streptomyces sp. S07_1.15]
MSTQSASASASATEARRVATGGAHAKAILLGEHAVVYGAPALALPLPALNCRATISRSERARPGPLRLRRTVSAPAPVPAPRGLDEETEEDAPEEFRLLLDAFARRAGLRGTPSLEVLLDSGIPAARGLGSSAANARALVHALDSLFATGLGERDVFELVQVSERSAHGLASGIDALTTGSTGPVLLAEGRRGKPPVGTAFQVVVADSGSGCGTRKAVTMLRGAFARDPGSRARFVDRSAALTRAALGDLADGRLAALGRRLTAAHELLAGLGLTTERTDTLAGAALGAGALGAKMSGGGLGGCVLALTATPEEAEAVAGALSRGHGARTWTAPVAKGAGHDGF